MGRADETDVNLTGEHRLRGPASDNEHRFDLDAVFAEKALFARHPGCRHVGIDRALGEYGF